MANKQTRMKKILETLSECETETVKNLAKTIGVSEMTIRRDVTYLQDNDFVNVFHGGVSINSKQKDVVSSFQYTPYLFDKAEKERLTEKMNIAEFATSLIDPFDAIGIDNGTTCRHMLDYLYNISNCILYTYSMQVLIKAANLDTNNIRLFCFGGLYHKDIKMFESIDELEIVKKTHIDKLFLGAVGVSAVHGLSCAERYELDIRKTLMSVSDQIIVLADSSKIDKAWPLKYGEITDVDILVTDNHITEEQTKSIEDCGVKVYVV